MSMNRYVAERHYPLTLLILISSLISEVFWNDLFEWEMFSAVQGMECISDSLRIHERFLYLC